MHAKKEYGGSSDILPCCIVSFSKGESRGSRHVFAPPWCLPQRNLMLSLFCRDHEFHAFIRWTLVSKGA